MSVFLNTLKHILQITFQLFYTSVVSQTAFIRLLNVVPGDVGKENSKWTLRRGGGGGGGRGPTLTSCGR